MSIQALSFLGGTGKLDQDRGRVSIAYVHQEQLHRPLVVCQTLKPAPLTKAPGQASGHSP